MAIERVDVTALATAAIGDTLYTLDKAEPNTVLEIRGSAVMVRTKDTGPVDGSAVQLKVIQDAADRLLREGEIRVSPKELGHRRSSFVGALLATDPRVVALTKPLRLRLRSGIDLTARLEEALTLIPRTRTTPAAQRGEPLFNFMADTLRDELAGVLDDDPTYKVQGSAGNGNWAETPWAAVFDRAVTESATRGHYLVYLFRRDGERVYLSLNQGTTAIFETERRGYQETLASLAREYAGLLGPTRLRELHTGPVDLGGGRPPLTPGYEAGNIAAIHYDRGAVPDTDILANDLDRMLRLYSVLTERIDRISIGTDAALEKGEAAFEEERRLAWHRRYEGRNRGVVKAAKKAQGFACKGCGVDYQKLYGPPGERCVDAHHLVPFSELGTGIRKLNPVRDFAILCSNCHRLIHSSQPPLTVTELRELLGVE